MSDDTAADPHLRRRLERVRGTWSDDDPLVLVFPGETVPVVAHVSGDWRYLSDRLERPRTTDRLNLEVAAYRRGLPSIEPLSAHAARFDRRDFESPPGAETESSAAERSADDRPTETAGPSSREDRPGSVASDAALSTDGGERTVSAGRSDARATREGRR